MRVPGIHPLASRHRRPWRALVASLACSGLLGGVVVGTASADGVGDQAAKVQQISDQLDSIANRIGQLDEDYGAAQDKKDGLDVEIAASQAKVDAEQTQLNALQSTLTQIAVEKYTSGKSTQLSPLFSDPSSYSDAQQRDELSRLSINSGAGDVDEMQALATSLAKEKANLERKQAQAVALVTSLASKKDQAVKLEADYKDQFSAAQAKYGDLVQQEQVRRAAAAVAKANQIAQQQQASDAAAAQAKADAQAAANAANAAKAANAASTKPPTTTSKPAPAGTSAGRGGGGAATGGDTGAAAAGGDTGTTTPAADNSGAGGGSGSSTPPPSSKAGIAVSAAYGQLGVPYQFAAESPGVAFDCSGLTKFAWGRAGVSLPHQSTQQYAVTPHITQAEIQPGDLVFYHSPIGHVAIYIGGGQIIHSPRTGDVVNITTVNWGNVVGISRPG
jgi:cell wall-associated NlpC family hydrolase